MCKWKMNSLYFREALAIVSSVHKKKKKFSVENHYDDIKVPEFPFSVFGFIVLGISNISLIYKSKIDYKKE